MNPGIATRTDESVIAPPDNHDPRESGGKFDALWQDIRFGARILYKKPGFTLIAVLTLALGIGANTAIFSVVNASLLTPIPIPDPDRVFMVWTDRSSQGSTGFPASMPDFVDWQNSGVFQHLAGFIPDGFNLVVHNSPERIQGLSVTGEWFQTLQATPYLGRLFQPDDMQPGHNHVAVLSYQLWYSRFGADTGVIGKTTLINSVPYTIVGVAPQKIARLATEEIYLPLLFEPPLSNERGMWLVDTLGRLAPNVTVAAARNRMADISARLAKEYPKENGGTRVRLQPVEQAYVQDINALIWILFGAVGFVLLVACANIANLLLVRGTSRRKEIAIRSALGAGRARLIQQLLTESVLLSLIGGVAGIIPAILGIRFLIRFKPEELPNAELIRLNPAVLVFTLALACFTGLLFGVIPAWQAWRANANSPLRERSQASGRELRFGNFLVIAEMALTLVLVAGAALMLRSFIELRSAYPGYDPRNVLTMRVSLSGKQYEAPEKQVLFYKELLRQLNELPGVRQAAVIDSLPTSYDVVGGTLHFTDRPEPKKGEAPIVVIGSVTPDFFTALHIPLLRGRSFTDADTANSTKTVILDEKTAQRYWPNRDPIGQLVYLSLGTPARRVIGIVGAIDRSIATKLKAHMGQAYVPFAQSPNPQNLPNPEISLVIACETSPMNLIGSIRQVISSLAPDQPVYQVETMDEARALERMSSKFGTWLLSFFAFLSLLLAAIGIYGVVSYSVEQRTREIGVRMALGATPGDLLLAAIGKGLVLTMTGLALGLAGALILTRTMGSLLHGISAIDPVSFIAAAVVLVVIGLLATYIPAYRASCIEPMTALRHE